MRGLQGNGVSLGSFYVLLLFNLHHISAFQGLVVTDSKRSLQRPPRIRRLSTSTTSTSTCRPGTPSPIDPASWPDKFPAREHCSKCGLCETTFVSQVTQSCAFLEAGMSRMDELEVVVHGRQRQVDSLVWSDDDNNGSSSGSSTAEEGRFGVLYEPVRLAQGVGIPGAQWTGVVTGIACSMLDTGQVDAVVCIAAAEDSNESSWSSPEPILARTVQEVLRGRGVKPALAPSLRVLDEIQQDDSVKRLLFCGVGCAVQAFRAVQDQLQLEQVYVLGTNCADNSPTPEAAERFLREGVRVADKKIRGYEFMQDFNVHVKTDNAYITRPYFSLPGTIAEPSIAKSCLACFDYTNALADISVGYMGAPLVSGARMDESYQTLTVRNERGAQMVQTAVKAGRLRLGKVAVGQGKHESLAAATVQSDTIVMAMTGRPVPESGMPVWMGKILAFVISNVGPKGINFARYSIDYHILRNYLHVVDEWGEERASNGMPRYAKDIVDHYIRSDPKFGKLCSEVAAALHS